MATGFKAQNSKFKAQGKLKNPSSKTEFLGGGWLF
jgi:hypothetical protein